MHNPLFGGTQRSWKSYAFCGPENARLLALSFNVSRENTSKPSPQVSVGWIPGLDHIPWSRCHRPICWNRLRPETMAPSCDYGNYPAAPCATWTWKVPEHRPAMLDKPWLIIWLWVNLGYLLNNMKKIRCFMGMNVPWSMVHESGVAHGHPSQHGNRSTPSRSPGSAIHPQNNTQTMEYIRC